MHGHDETTPAAEGDTSALRLAHAQRLGARLRRQHAVRQFARRAACVALVVLACAAGIGWTQQHGWRTWFAGETPNGPLAQVAELVSALPDADRLRQSLEDPDFASWLATLPGLPARFNPWAPLTLTEPDGPFTQWKIGTLEAGPDACRAWLADAPEVASAPVPDRADSADSRCGWEGASRIAAIGVARLSSPVTLACGSAVALVRWERLVVQPAAQRLLGSRVVRIEHFGSYACRAIAGGAGTASASARMSEHAHANAIDIAAFDLADGRRISVLRDWRSAPDSPIDRAAAERDKGDEGDAASQPAQVAESAAVATPGGPSQRAPPTVSPRDPRAEFLQAVRDGACHGFSAVLGPDYNAAHRNHFHLDRGRYRVCR